MTDVYDYLRLLFARVVNPLVWTCGREIRAYTIEQIVENYSHCPFRRDC